MPLDSNFYMHTNFSPKATIITGTTTAFELGLELLKFLIHSRYRLPGEPGTSRTIQWLGRLLLPLPHRCGIIGMGDSVEGETISYAT